MWREDTKDLLIISGGGIGCCLLILLSFAGMVFTLAAVRWVIQ